MNECSICLENITSNTEIILECNHIFHKKCISKLLKFNCPICRKSINIKKIFNIDKKICINDEFHYDFGYTPNVKDGPCRFCFGKPFSYYLE
jgi:hypothetical protein